MSTWDEAHVLSKQLSAEEIEGFIEDLDQDSDITGITPEHLNFIDDVMSNGLFKWTGKRKQYALTIYHRYYGKFPFEP